MSEPTDIYTEALVEAFANSPVNAFVIETLELYHEAIGSLYYVLDTVPHTLKKEDGTEVTYKASDYYAPEPDKNEKGGEGQSISFTRDNTVLGFAASARDEGGLLYVKKRFYLLGDDEPQNKTPIEYIVSDVKVDSGAMQASLVYATNAVNLPFPRRTYNRQDNPSLGAS